MHAVLILSLAAPFGPSDPPVDLRVAAATFESFARHATSRSRDAVWNLSGEDAIKAVRKSRGQLRKEQTAYLEEVVGRIDVTEGTGEEAAALLRAMRQLLPLSAASKFADELAERRDDRQTVVAVIEFWTRSGRRERAIQFADRAVEKKVVRSIDVVSWLCAGEGVLDHRDRIRPHARQAASEFAAMLDAGSDELWTPALSQYMSFVPRYPELFGWADDLRSAVRRAAEGGGCGVSQTAALRLLVRFPEETLTVDAAQVAPMLSLLACLDEFTARPAVGDRERGEFAAFFHLVYLHPESTDVDGFDVAAEALADRLNAPRQHMRFPGVHPELSGLLLSRRVPRPGAATP